MAAHVPDPRQMDMDAADVGGHEVVKLISQSYDAMDVDVEAVVELRDETPPKAKKTSKERRATTA